MKAKDVMTQLPICTWKDTAEKAASLMKEFDTGALPVVDDPKNQLLLGIVTDRDLCIQVVAEALDPTCVRMDRFLTSTPLTCHPEDEVVRVMAAMRHRRCKYIGVVDERNRLQGVVSADDLIRDPNVNRDEIQGLLRSVSHRMQRISRHPTFHQFVP